ncbi:MAG TPA: hypothetical protein VK923_13805 [Euzebyales bacterium]|nr:hypothetical protein [Euzebyales bacterium]
MAAWPSPTCGATAPTHGRPPADRRRAADPRPPSPPWPAERAAYFRAISRFEAVWPLVEAVARIVLDGDVVTHAAIAVGGVATVPLRLPTVEGALVGSPATREALTAAAAVATNGATPLPRTGYKLTLLTGTVLDAGARDRSLTPQRRGAPPGECDRDVRCVRSPQPRRAPIPGEPDHHMWAVRSPESALGRSDGATRR